MIDENSIVNRILSGDTSAVERLVDLYESRVYQYALRYLGQENEAEQAVIEIFRQIFRKLGAKTDSQMYIWVFRITANVCADIQRHKRGNKSTMAVFRLREVKKGGTDEKKELDEAIQAQLLRLTRQQREVILLRDLCGLDDMAAGQVLGMDEDGIRKRLSRARKNLRDLLLRQGALTQTKEKAKDNQNCQDFRELCSQYVDECITEEDKAALLDHIQICPQCAAYLNDLTLIGRSLSHMEEGEAPECLREKLIENAKRQSQEIKNSRRRGTWIPTLILVAVAAVFTVLNCTGILGGLYVNSIADLEESDISAVERRGDQAALLENITIPDAVTSNSYAFVIAAEGESTLPELSASATLLTADDSSQVEYYAVDNDFSLVQKLTEGMESLGYDLESVNNNQLIITSSSGQGLFVVIHKEQ